MMSTNDSFLAASSGETRLNKLNVGLFSEFEIDPQSSSMIAGCLIRIVRSLRCAVYQTKNGDRIDSQAVEREKHVRELATASRARSVGKARGARTVRLALQ